MVLCTILCVYFFFFHYYNYNIIKYLDLANFCFINKNLKKHLFFGGSVSVVLLYNN